MKDLVLSCFEPFGNDEINSSAIVSAMIPECCGNVRVTKTILPVVYKKSYEILYELISEVKPDFVICMGQAGGRKKISIEKIAVNINNSTSSDNKGKVFCDEIIISDGGLAYAASLPVLKMLQACNSEFAEISYSAGTFVCNDLFYRMLYNECKSKEKHHTGFLHLPYTEHFSKMPFIESNKQAEAIMAMIAALGEDNG